MFNVPCGLVGPAGVNALQIVTVELNHEHANVKMGKRTNVQDRPYTNSNVIDNHANLE